MKLTALGRSVLSVAVVSTTAWVFLRSPLLAGVAAGLLSAIGIAALLIWTQPSISGRQVVSPGAVEVGGAAIAVVSIANDGRRSTMPLTVVNGVGAHRVMESVSRLSPKSTTVVRMELPTGRRGVHRIGPLELLVNDPLRLVSRTVQAGAPQELTIFPRTRPIGVIPTGTRRELEGVGQSPQEGGVAFHSLREYEPGDDLRLIDWRSVARTGELVVRRNVITTEPRLMVVLDTAAASYADEESFESAVEVASSLVKAGCESRYPLAFRTTDGGAADISPAGVGTPAAMKLLAGATRTVDNPGLSQLGILARRDPGVSVGAVTAQPDASAVAGASHARTVFDVVTLFQVGRSITPVRVGGLLAISGETCEDVAAQWRARVS